MWSSVTADLAERLVPDGGKGLLGEAKYCRECEGRGYTKKPERLAGLPQLLRGTLLDYQINHNGRAS